MVEGPALSSSLNWNYTAIHHKEHEERKDDFSGRTSKQRTKNDGLSTTKTRKGMIAKVRK